METILQIHRKIIYPITVVNVATKWLKFAMLTNFSRTKNIVPSKTSETANFVFRTYLRDRISVRTL